MRPELTEGCEEIPSQYSLMSYDYQLPRRLISQTPHESRDKSRLLLIQKSGALKHLTFSHLPQLVENGDVLVLNDTRVVPALLVVNKPTGGKVELLILDPAKSGASGDSPVVRTCMAKAAKYIKPAGSLIMDGLEIKVLENQGKGIVVVEFPVSEAGFLEFLQRYGRPPLPPYIRHEKRDRERDFTAYQTVYADKPGSIAAPTAGLHFTQELLAQCKSAGAHIVYVTLHVGPGTFLPVRTKDIRLHRMHSEYYYVPSTTADIINKATNLGNRIIPVGTTSLRTLETAADASGQIVAGAGTADLFVMPGYSFKLVKNLITNFHLPCSTLFILVCALAGSKVIREAYGEAIRAEYSFFSYGDACVILDQPS